MISFRYHLVTVLAIFLALGLGILIGTTVVRQSLIDELENRAQGAIERTRQLERDVADLRSELDASGDFAEAAEELMIAGKLAGRSAVVVTAGDVDLAEVEGVRRAIDSAGAILSGVLVVTERMALAGDGDGEALAGALGLSPTLSGPNLARQAASRVGSRLAGGPTAGDDGRDVLEDLVAGGFIDTQATGRDGVAGIGGSGQVVVVLTGGDAPPAVAPADFFLPLIVALTQSQHPVAAGETQESAYEFVSLLRGDSALDGRLLTIDNADTAPGRVALVLGLESMLGAGLEPCRDFGVKAGACGLLPQPLPSP